LKQWTPRCSQQIKEIYDNDPKKGNSFLEPKLNALYEPVHHKKAEDLSNFLQNLRSRLKPQISEEEAKYQVNFKPNKKNAQKIEYLKGKLGLTDSEIFEILVLMETLLEISPIEPSIEQSKEIPEILEIEPSEQTEIEYERFPCDKLCRKFYRCTNNAMFYLGEIVGSNCFVTRFPTKCWYVIWESTQPQGDPEHPYPKCVAKQKDVPLELPKDRIIRDPEFCWKCIKIRKRQRELAKEKQMYQRVKSEKPIVNWYESHDIPSSAWWGE